MTHELVDNLGTIARSVIKQFGVEEWVTILWTMARSGTAALKEAMSADGDNSMVEPFGVDEPTDGLTENELVNNLGTVARSVTEAFNDATSDGDDNCLGTIAKDTAALKEAQCVGGDNFLIILAWMRTGKLVSTASSLLNVVSSSRFRHYPQVHLVNI